MTFDQARLWLVTRSLIMITVFGLVLILSPATPYPLEFDQALAVLQMIFPLFLGYLSSAVIYITLPPTRAAKEPITDLLGVLIKWPFYVVVILCLSVFIAFGIRNWPNSAPVNGHGMSFDTMTSLFSLILGIHTATTSAIVAYLFKKEQ